MASKRPRAKRGGGEKKLIEMREEPREKNAGPHHPSLAITIHFKTLWMQIREAFKNVLADFVR